LCTHPAVGPLTPPRAPNVRKRAPHSCLYRSRSPEVIWWGEVRSGRTGLGNSVTNASLRTLGRTALPVTRIGLGLAAVGRPAYMTLGRAADLGADRSVETMRARSMALLDAAHAGGVRYVDVARSYGRAEEFLGAWLSARGIPPGAVTVGSKWGYRYT